MNVSTILPSPTLDHCQKIFSQPYPNDDRLYCNATYDGVRCWNYTLAGSRAYGGCPEEHPSSNVFGPGGYSFKDCNEDGTWWTHPISRMPWTNYSPCMSHENVERSMSVIYVYLAGFASSILLLVLSLIIFTYFRQLKCTRVTIHKHLFASYILSGLLWILYYTQVSLKVSVLNENPLWCRILHGLTQYTTLCNYGWMLCEGFYLHAVIVVTFTSERRLLLICFGIGWGVPIIVTTVYAAVRGSGSTPKMIENCWIYETTHMWILMGPIVLSLLVNFVFLVNILRILLSKLRAVNTQESHQYRRTLKACLILVPLLGIQYIMMPFEPTGDTYVYDVIRAALTSFQGAFIAALFCFFNGEVMQQIKRRVKTLNDIRNGSRRSQSTNDQNTQKSKFIEPVNRKIQTTNNSYQLVPLQEVPDSEK